MFFSTTLARFGELTGICRIPVMFCLEMMNTCRSCQGIRNTLLRYTCYLAPYTWHLVPDMLFCHHLALLVNALPRSSLNRKKDQLLRRLSGARYIHAHIMALWGVSRCQCSSSSFCLWLIPRLSSACHSFLSYSHILGTWYPPEEIF